MSSYTIPSVIEKTLHGERAVDIYSRLLTDRIIYIGTEIDDGVANVVIAQLLHLESESPEVPINLYLNSPGGSVTASLAIYDTMQFVSSPVQHDLRRPGRQQCRTPPRRWYAGQPDGPAARPRRAPPTVDRRPGRPARPRPPGQGDRAPARGDGVDPGPPHRPERRAPARGHRPRPRPRRAGVGRLRAGRRDPGQPEGAA